MGTPRRCKKKADTVDKEQRLADPGAPLPSRHKVCPSGGQTPRWGPMAGSCCGELLRGAAAGRGGAPPSSSRAVRPAQRHRDHPRRHHVSNGSERAGGHHQSQRRDCNVVFTKISVIMN